jgi:hypothetical protein
MSILKLILRLVAIALLVTIASQMFSFTLLAQTSELLPEPQPTPTPAPLVKKPRVTQGSKWGLCGRQQAASQRSSGFTGDTAGTYISDIQVDLYSNNYSTVTLNWANENLSIELGRGRLLNPAPPN